MFKCLQFIDEKLRQLNEADETVEEDVDNTEETVEEDVDNADETSDEESFDSEDTEMSEDAPENTNMSDADYPNKIADVENGTFLSDIGNAEVAKSMLKALMIARPNDNIPTQFQTVTTDNANAIIEYVKATLALDLDDFGKNLNNI